VDQVAAEISVESGSVLSYPWHIGLWIPQPHLVAMCAAERVPEFDGLSVVFLGSFNPGIFHPDWFVRNELLTVEDVKGADIVITNQVAMFTAEWLLFRATSDTLSIEASQPQMALLLRDLAMGIFRILGHCPIDAIGFNRLHHYRLESVDDWIAFSDSRTLGQLWQDVLEIPQLKTITFAGKRNTSGSIVEIKIEPSVRVRPGVFTQVNEHWDFPRIELPIEERLPFAMHALLDHWDSFLDYANGVSSDLVAHCGGGNE